MGREVIYPESSQCHWGMQGLRGQGKEILSQTSLAFVSIDATPSPFLEMIKGGFAGPGVFSEGHSFPFMPWGSSRGSWIPENQARKPKPAQTSQSPNRNLLSWFEKKWRQLGTKLIRGFKMSLDVTLISSSIIISLLSIYLWEIMARFRFWGYVIKPITFERTLCPQENHWVTWVKSQVHSWNHCNQSIKCCADRLSVTSPRFSVLSLWRVECPQRHWDIANLRQRGSWEGGLVGKSLVMQAWGAEFEPSEPT